MSQSTAPDSPSRQERLPLDQIYFSLLGLAGVVLIALYLVRLAQGAKIDWSATIGALAAIATILGIVIGGLWGVWLFKRQRVGEARMDIAQASQIWKGSDGKFVLRLGVTFKNIGLINLTPMVATSTVQRPPDGLLDFRKQPGDYWVEVCSIDHPIATDEVDMEPGESETYWHDVALPEGITFVQVYSVISCEGRDKKFWDETLLVPVLDPGAFKGLAPRGVA